MSERVRLALTISGAVSLGAFEGGALAALLTFVQEAGAATERGQEGHSSHDDQRSPSAIEGGGADGWPVTVDVMSGASAGSITALVAARTLTAGLDPVAAMQAAWVTAPSLRTLTRGAARAPLTPDGLRAQATAILTRPAAAPVQPTSVTVHMALTALEGLRYTIPDLAWGRPLRATTHLDWGELTFAPGAPVEAWTSPVGGSAVDIALASGASPLGFPPYPVNRKLRADDWEGYTRNGVEGLPADGWIWYTDGGTIENEPLGRTLDLAAEADRGSSARRVHVLVHPHPTGGAAERAWSGPEGPDAAWLRALARADRIQRTQTLFDDLRRAEKTNSRLMWRSHLQGRLLAHRASLDEAGRRSFDTALREALGDIDSDRSRLRAQAGGDRVALTSALPPGGTGDLAGDPGDLLAAVLDEITGTGGAPVAFAMISPTDLAEHHGITVEQLLAGEFLFHFGGFLDDRLRAHDFAIGYEAARRWLREAIRRGGPLQELADAAGWLAAVDQRQPDWGLPPPVPDTTARWQALVVGLRAGGLAARDVLAWRPWRRR